MDDDGLGLILGSPYLQELPLQTYTPDRRQERAEQLVLLVLSRE